MCFQCPGCGHVHTVDDVLAGRQMTCQQCQQVLVVPAPVPEAVVLPASDPPPAAIPLGSEAAHVPDAPPAAVRRGPARAPSVWDAPRRRPPREGLSSGDKTALRLGLFLAAMGVLGFILPLAGVQLKVLRLLGRATPIVAAGLAIGGALVTFYGLRRNVPVACAASGGILGALLVAWLVSPFSRDDWVFFQKESAWRRVDCAEGGFSVEFPGDPKTVHRKDPTPAVQLEMQTPHKRYSAISTKLPMLRVSARQLLKQLPSSLPAELGRAERSRSVRLSDGTPGLAIDAVGPKGERLDIRVYVFKGRLYETIAATNRKAPTPASADRFHRSFRLTDSNGTVLARADTPFEQVARPPEPVVPPRPVPPAPKPPRRPRPVRPRPHRPRPPAPKPATPARPAPRPPADAGPLDLALFYLKEGDVHRRTQVVRELATTPVDEARRGEVAKALRGALASPHSGVALGALQALVTWQTPECVPDMAKLASHPDRDLRRAAFGVLAQVKDKRVAAAIAARLAEDGATAGDALRALGPVAEDAVLGQLGRVDGRGRAEACRVLEAIGSDKCIAPLARRIGDRDGSVRAAAQAALKARGKAAEDALLACLERGDPATRAEACKLLATMGTAKAAAKLAPLLGAGDHSTRAAAYRALEGLGAAAEDAVLKYFAGADKRGFEEACRLLETIGSEKALAPLAARLADPDRSVRARARGLLEKRGAAAEDAVLEHLKHKDKDVRGEALDLLARIGTEKCIEAVAPLLADPESSVRDRARRVLEERGGKAAEGAVAKYLSHGSQETRRAAIELLRKIGTAKSVPKLIPLLADGDFFVRVAARRAIEDRGAAAEDALLKAIRRAPTKVRGEMCGILGKVGTRKSLPTLRILARSKDFHLKNAATRAGQAIAARRK